VASRVVLSSIELVMQGFSYHLLSELYTILIIVNGNLKHSHDSKKVSNLDLISLLIPFVSSLKICV
jgi:hypothetical protein